MSSFIQAISKFKMSPLINYIAKAFSFSVFISAFKWLKCLLLSIKRDFCLKDEKLLRSLQKYLHGGTRSEGGILDFGLSTYLYRSVHVLPMIGNSPLSLVLILQGRHLFGMHTPTKA